MNHKLPRSRRKTDAQISSKVDALSGQIAELKRTIEQSQESQKDKEKSNKIDFITAFVALITIPIPNPVGKLISSALLLFFIIRRMTKNNYYVTIMERCGFFLMGLISSGLTIEYGYFLINAVHVKSTNFVAGISLSMVGVGTMATVVMALVCFYFCCKPNNITKEQFLKLQKEDNIKPKRTIWNYIIHHLKPEQ